MARKALVIPPALSSDPAERQRWAVLDQMLRELYATIDQLNSATGQTDVTTFNASPITVTTESDIVILRASPAATTINLPPVADRFNVNLRIVDHSTSVTNHVITINPSGTETIARQSSWQMISTAYQLSSLELRPSETLGGWVIV